MINTCQKGSFSEKLFNLMIEARDSGEGKPVEIPFFDGNSAKFSIAVNKLMHRYCQDMHFCAQKIDDKMYVFFYGERSFRPKPNKNTAMHKIMSAMNHVANSQTNECFIGEILSKNGRKYSDSGLITAIKSLSVHFPGCEFYTRTCHQTGGKIIGVRREIGGQ